MFPIRGRLGLLISESIVGFRFSIAQRTGKNNNWNGIKYVTEKNLDVIWHEYFVGSRGHLVKRRH